jgi:hypothetical protein
MTTHDDPVRWIARAAGRRLASARRPGLAVEIESALDERRARGGGRESRPDRYVDVISLASLIVAAADLAWAVYVEVRKKDAKPAATIAQRLRIELGESRVIEPGERDRVIEVVVDQVISSDDQF